MSDEHHTRNDASNDKELTLAADGGVPVDNLKSTVQDAQDTIESVEDDIPAEAFIQFETVESTVENLEDSLEHADGDIPAGFKSEIQTAQDDLTEFRKNLPDADPSLRRRIDELEDILESLEDTTAAQNEGYGVKVRNHNVVFFEDPSPEAEDILARVEEDTDAILVAQDDSEITYSGNNEVPLSENGIERFTVEPTTPGNS